MTIRTGFAKFGGVKRRFTKVGESRDRAAAMPS
jgi:UDP-N-acetylmuramate-alanine ligase